MEPLGAKIRVRRKEMGLTLDALSARTRVSKPYLSLIETGRVSNPPSDEKLRRLEHALKFAPGELVGQAHLLRTPGDVRAMLLRLLQDQAKGGAVRAGDAERAPREGGLDLDRAHAGGALRALAEGEAGNVEPAARRLNAVPVINKMSAGYPEDFTDLGYPPRHADAYVSGPDVDDPDAFAARVWGDSMRPLYTEGDIVIFSPARVPRDGDDCFVRFADGRTTFKRVFFEPPDESTGDPGVIRLQPRNETYRPQLVEAEAVSGIYRAVFRFERVNGG